MLLVDTSVWIDLLGKRPSVRLDREQLLRVAICPPIVQEVLQGIKDDGPHARLRESLLALPIFASPVELDTFLHAASIFRTGRRLGHTVRSTFDCLIAAIALENKLTVWHRDRDYAAIARFTDLRVTEEYI